MPDFVRIRNFPSRAEAERAKARLAAAGITAAVTADDASGWQPGPSYVSGVTLSVKGSDAAEARTLLGQGSNPTPNRT